MLTAIIGAALLIAAVLAALAGGAEQYRDGK